MHFQPHELADTPWLDIGETHQERKPSAFDFATRLLVPTLTLIALIFTQVNGKQPGLAWSLVGLTLLSLGVGFLPSVKTKMHKWSEQAKDKAVATQAFPEFRKFVNRFHDFVVDGRCDTLHYIVQDELVRGDGIRYQQLAMPGIGFWGAPLEFFLRRIDAQRPSMVELKMAIEEFHFLVGSYNNQCVSQVFERLPQDLQSSLTSRTKANLNSFEQRFDHFLTDYQNFTKELCASRPALRSLQGAFAHPKPLA